MLAPNNIVAAMTYPIVWVKDMNLSITTNPGAIVYQMPGPKEYNPYLGCKHPVNHVIEN